MLLPALSQKGHRNLHGHTALATRSISAHSFCLFNPSAPALVAKKNMKNFSNIPMGEKACEILKLTFDGDQLEPYHLELLQAAVNNHLTDQGKQFFETLYQQVVVDKQYHKPFLCGVEHMTRDHQGYVYFKGHCVEHYTFSAIDVSELPKMVQQLQRDCLKVEQFGLPVGISMVGERSLWEGISKPYDPFLFFIQHRGNLYQKGHQVVNAYSHSVDPKSNALTQHYTLINTKTQESENLSVNTDQGFYHWVLAKGFQSVENFQSRDQWEGWFQKNNFKLWLLNPNAYWEFMLKSIDVGHTIEIPESTYDHFLGCVPPLTMNRRDYKEDRMRWFINSEPYAHTEKGTIYTGGARAGDQFFLKRIVIIQNQINH